MIAAARGLLYLAILTSSFDLVGVFHIGGANARVSSLLVLAAFGVAILVAAEERRLERPVGFGWLLIWTGLNILFLPNSPYLFRSGGYLAWLLTDVALILSVCTLFKDEESALRLGRWTWYSYLALSAFGLMQFLSAALHVSNLLVVSRLSGAIPRLNGLSYEPSYFATYLIAGWVLSGYLLLKRVYLIKRPTMIAVMVLQTGVLVLTTSRIGYIGLVLASVWLGVVLVGTPGMLRTREFGMAVFIGAIAVGITVGVTFFLIKDDPSALFAGTGLFETASHSVDQRLEGIEACWDLILEHPLTGYSLGGVAGALADATGAIVSDYDDLRHAQGINVTLEIILATGLIGAACFFGYLGKLIVQSVRLARRVPQSTQSVLLEATVVGILLQFLLLQFNQNVLRNYLWVQIAVASCLYACVKRMNASPPDVNEDTPIGIESKQVSISEPPPPR